VNALLGHLGVWLAFTASILGALLLLWSLRSKAQGAELDVIPFALLPMVALGGALLATFGMQRALITHDFSLVYVAANNAKVTPLIYSITGMWSALAGSILLWALAMAAATTLVVRATRDRRDDQVTRIAVLVMMVITAFFFLLMLGPADPFQLVVGVRPVTGAGPNALLQNNPLVAIHPPLLYTGMVGFSVPFAFAIGMLVTGRVDEPWLVTVRRATVFTWTLLSLGLVLGAWWSYQVLGWGGFWGWDPVENAALLPWLCGTALVHSLVVQERRGLLRVWNLCLAIAAFSLTLLATFLTRSGIIESVHAFSASSLGPILISAFAVAVGTGFGLLLWRGDRLRSPQGIDSGLSKEGAFVLNNLVFVGFALVVLLGTLFPLAYEALNGSQVTVGAPYFSAVAVPVGLFLLMLMAVAPVLSWRVADLATIWQRLETSVWIASLLLAVLVIFGVRGLAPLSAFWLGMVAAGSALRTLARQVSLARRRGDSVLLAFSGRTSGGMVVHLGIVILATGIVAATSYVQRGELTLHPQESRNFAGHHFRFTGLREIRSPQRNSTVAVIKIDGKAFGPAVNQFGGSSSAAVGTPAIDSSWRGDIYLTLDAIGQAGSVSGPQVSPNLSAGAVAIGVSVEPLIPWIWAGGLVVGLGGILAIVGPRRREREAGEDASSEPAEASA